MCLMVREPVHTQLSNSSFAEMTRSWPPFHLKTSLVPFSTVISCGAWGMAFQNPEVLTPITRSVGAAVSSVALVPRSEELLSAPATIAASISIIGVPKQRSRYDALVSLQPAAACKLPGQGG